MLSIVYYSIIPHTLARSISPIEYNYKLDHSNYEDLPSSRSCTSFKSTYVLNLFPVIQESIKTAIYDVRKNGNASQYKNDYIYRPDEDSESMAVKSYLGTILDEINTVLGPRSVQLDLATKYMDLNALTTESLVDTSCEILNAAENRANNLYQKISETSNADTGFVLGVFLCPKASPIGGNYYIKKNGNCGRTIAVIWNGSVETSDIIKNAILEAITDIKGLYSDESGRDKKLDSPYSRLCSYCDKCIGSTPTTMGQLHEGRKTLGFTVKFEPGDSTADLDLETAVAA